MDLEHSLRHISHSVFLRQRGVIITAFTESAANISSSSAQYSHSCGVFLFYTRFFASHLASRRASDEIRKMRTPKAKRISDACSTDYNLLLRHSTIYFFTYFSHSRVYRRFSLEIPHSPSSKTGSPESDIDVHTYILIRSPLTYVPLNAARHTSS